MKPTLAEYLVEIKARRERYLELCDEAGVPLDGWAAHEAILAFDSHTEGDIEALVGMVEMLWRSHDNQVTVKPSHLQTQVVALIPEEAPPSTPPNAS